MFGRKLDTGDRVVIFKKIHKDIPSYVPVRDWKAYMMYTGQPKTCRSCGNVDHFAKDCSSKRKPDETFSEDQNIFDKKRKSDKKSAEDQDIPVNMDIVEPSGTVVPTEEQLIKELMVSLTEVEPDPVELVQDKLNEIQSVTDRSEVTTSVSFLTKIKVEKESPSIDKSCGPQISKDSSSGAEGSAALPKQTAERNLAHEDDKHVSSHISGVKPLGAKDSMQGATGVGKKKKKKAKKWEHYPGD